MYICQWADPDVGNFSDDFVGCDTILNLGYAYNSTNADAVYQNIGLHPPAIGYSFLQGVAAPSANPNDSAVFNFRWRKGYKYVNLKSNGNKSFMSSFDYFGNGVAWQDPTYDYRRVYNPSGNIHVTYWCCPNK